MLDANFTSYEPGQLGVELNITARQLEKYERGANRYGVSFPGNISQILDVPVS